MWDVTWCCAEKVDVSSIEKVDFQFTAQTLAFYAQYFIPISWYSMLLDIYLTQHQIEKCSRRNATANWRKIKNFRETWCESSLTILSKTMLSCWNGYYFQKVVPRPKIKWSNLRRDRFSCVVRNSSAVFQLCIYSKNRCIRILNLLHVAQLKYFPEYFPNRNFTNGISFGEKRILVKQLRKSIYNLMNFWYYFIVKLSTILIYEKNKKKEL